MGARCDVAAGDGANDSAPGKAAKATEPNKSGANAADKDSPDAKDKGDGKDKPKRRFIDHSKTGPSAEEVIAKVRREGIYRVPAGGAGGGALKTIQVVPRWKLERRSY